MDSSKSGTGWTFGPLTRGYRLVGLIGSLLVMSVLTIAFNDSTISNWGIERNGGWQLVSNGHYNTKVLAGGRTDLTSGKAYVKGGQRLVLDYTVSVDSGSTFINVYNSLNLSEDALYYESIAHDRQRHLEIQVPHSGLYAIDMAYYRFRGEFDVRWHVE